MKTNIKRLLREGLISESDYGVYFKMVGIQLDEHITYLNTKYNDLGHITVLNIIDTKYKDFNRNIDNFESQVRAKDKLVSKYNEEVDKLSEMRNNRYNDIIDVIDRKKDICEAKENVLSHVFNVMRTINETRDEYDNDSFPFDDNKPINRG